jgi:type IV pilus assembly protein PilC
MTLFSLGKTAPDKLIPASSQSPAAKLTRPVPNLASTSLHRPADPATRKVPLHPQGAFRTKTPARVHLPFGKIISTMALAEFTRQLSTLVNAGLPILRSLDTLVRQEPNPAFQQVIAALGESIRSGGSLSDGLNQHPRVFDRLYINMVKAGEASGSLGTILDRLATFMEKAEKIRGKVKAAMAYPLVILGVASLIVAALMVFVIPRFQEIFASLLKGYPLPALTQAVVGASSFIQHHFLGTIGLIVAAAFAFKQAARTKPGRSLLDRAQLRMPVFGPLFLKAAISRFARTLGTLLASGVPVLQAIRIARDTSGNVHIAAALDQIYSRVEQGEGVGGPLAATRIFPSMVTSMVEVGEETGALPDMLIRVADTYEGAVDNAVNSITAIIEPIMIVFMAVVVGTIVIALFLPLVTIIVRLAG